MRSARRFALVAGLVLAPAGALVVAPVASAQEAVRKVERWQGVVNLPGMELEIFVSFRERSDGVLEARLDIPAQGLTGGGLEDVLRTDTEMKFRFAPQGAPHPAAFTLERRGDEASGTVDQAGQQFPIALRRLADGEAPRLHPDRAQNPRPPFPYTDREVQITSPVDGVTLAGTLTIPNGPGAGGRPAVVLLTGSGAQDRDETIFGHKPFWVIADHLARNGFAVLRCDDRGVGGSGGDPSLATIDTFVGDAIGAVDYLRAQPEVDAKRVGLVGHSEGGIVAPMAAVRSPDVAFIVLLAGTGVPGGTVWTGQNSAMLRVAGAPAAFIEAQDAARQDLVRAIEADAQGDELRAKVDAVIAVSMPPGVEVPADRVQQASETMFAVMDSPWFRSFIKTDPESTLRSVRCPVLAINGSKDLQVLPEPNLGGIERGLRAAGNRDVTILEMPGLNHLFQTARTGGMEEYATSEETFSPVALEVISAWLRDRAGLR